MGMFDMFGGYPGATPEQKQFMMQQGLLGAAGGLLSSSGWTDRPVTMGQALGQGLLGWQGGQTNALDVMMNQEKLGMLKAEQQAKAQAVLDKKNALNAISGADPIQKNVDPGAEMRALATIAPNEVAKQMLYKKFGNPQLDLDRQRLDQQKQYYDYLMNKGSAPADPYFSQMDTTHGKYILNNRTGKYELAIGPDGKPLLSAAVDPDNKRTVNAAGAFGTEQGKSDAASISDLGGVIDTAETALDRLDKLRTHPGKSYAIGMASVLPVVAGTSQQDFVTRLDELKGGAFLQAFESLKGGGQITEKEGEKAEAAIQRMNRALKEEDFNAALDDYEAIIAKGIARARRKAATASSRQGQGEMPDGNVPPPAGQPATKQNMVPPAALDYLRSNPTPEIKAQFKQKYGYLPEGM